MSKPRPLGGLLKELDSWQKGPKRVEVIATHPRLSLFWVASGSMTLTQYLAQANEIMTAHGLLFKGGSMTVYFSSSQLPQILFLYLSEKYIYFS